MFTTGYCRESGNSCETIVNGVCGGFYLEIMAGTCVAGTATSVSIYWGACTQFGWSCIGGPGGTTADCSYVSC